MTRPHASPPYTIVSPSVMPHECSACTSVTLIPSTSMVPPWLPPRSEPASMPFLPSQLVISKLLTIFGFVCLAISRASAMWSKWPWVMSIRSHRSTFFRLSGAAGFPLIQGSMRISFHLAERTFHVPCPTQVKLTSELSAIVDPRLLVVEKPIFPHAQNEQPDGGD